MNVGSWLKLVSQIAPLILAATPLAPLTPYVALGIQTAEQIPGATGTQKLALVQQIVATSVAGANAQAGRVVIDPDLVNSAASTSISAVVAAVNLAHGTPVVAPTV